MTKESMSSWFQSVVAVTIAMISFWMVEARHYITRDECDIAIKQSALITPYSQDKNLIFESINTQKQNNDNLVKALKENTDAITQLRIAFAIISNKEREGK